MSCCDILHFFVLFSIDKHYLISFCDIMYYFVLLYILLCCFELIYTVLHDCMVLCTLMSYCDISYYFVLLYIIFVLRYLCYFVMCFYMLCYLYWHAFDCFILWYFLLCWVSVVVFRFVLYRDMLFCANLFHFIL